MGGGQRLGVLELRLDLRPLLRRDAGGEEDRIDAEPLGEPGDGRLRRARLAALDLADVLLREARARELRLREAGRHAQRAHALAEAGARQSGAGDVAVSCMPISVNVAFRSPALPRSGDVLLPLRSQVTRSPNHLTWLLDFSGHGSYSQAHTADDRTPDRMRGHHRRIGRRAQDERGWAAEPRFAGSPPREGVASNGKRPRSRSRGRFRVRGEKPTVSPRVPPSLLPCTSTPQLAYGRMNRPSALEPSRSLSVLRDGLDGCVRFGVLRPRPRADGRGRTRRRLRRRRCRPRRGARARSRA